jgi:hypothetical protein
MFEPLPPAYVSMQPGVGFAARAGTPPVAVVPGVIATQLSPATGARAHTDGAVARLVGTVNKRVNTTTLQPVARLVRLHCQATGQMVAQTWSTPAGDYAFERVPAGRYMVLSVDHTGEFAGVLEPDVLVKIKPGQHEHRLVRHDPPVRAVQVPVFVRDRNMATGGGGGAGF